jgi:hypothetical protein
MQTLKRTRTITSIVLTIRGLCCGLNIRYPIRMDVSPLFPWYPIFTPYALFLPYSPLLCWDIFYLFNFPFPLNLFYFFLFLSHFPAFHFPFFKDTYSRRQEGGGDTCNPDIHVHPWAGSKGGKRILKKRTGSGPPACERTGPMKEEGGTKDSLQIQIWFWFISEKNFVPAVLFPPRGSILERRKNQILLLIIADTIHHRDQHQNKRKRAHRPWGWK